MNYVPFYDLRAGDLIYLSGVKLVDGRISLGLASCFNVAQVDVDDNDVGIWIGSDQGIVLIKKGIVKRYGGLYYVRIVAFSSCR